MQTFIPFDDFRASAKALDRQRLGKQRVEAKQILLALDRVKHGETERVGWVNHPAVKMWAGHEAALARYGVNVCVEWISRGYIDNMLPWFTAEIERHGVHLADHLPEWWGDQIVHKSHMAMLLRKDRDHYQIEFELSDEAVDIMLVDYPNYIWPVR